LLQSSILNTFISMKWPLNIRHQKISRVGWHTIASSIRLALEARPFGPFYHVTSGTPVVAILRPARTPAKHDRRCVIAG
jgi:hypothetical protein